jgi:hypothetical protein
MARILGAVSEFKIVTNRPTTCFRAWRILRHVKEKKEAARRAEELLKCGTLPYSNADWMKYYTVTAPLLPFFGGWAAFRRSAA